jgi:hypothetical protein
MLAKVPQLVRLPAIFVVLATLTGCQAIVSSPPVAQVRVITASPDAASLDIYKGSNPLAHSLGFGTVTSYIPLAPGADTVSANTAGTKQTLSISKANFAASSQYTVLIGNTAANLQQLTLRDQGQPAPPGQIALRFISQATRSGALDIYLVPAGQRLTSVSPIATNVLFGSNTGYLNSPAGTCTLVVLPSGTIPPNPSLAIYTGPQVSDAPGSVRTIILIDQQLTPGIQVITANDFEPAVD